MVIKVGGSNVTKATCLKKNLVTEKTMVNHHGDQGQSAHLCIRVKSLHVHNCVPVVVAHVTAEDDKANDFHSLILISHLLQIG